MLSGDFEPVVSEPTRRRKNIPFQNGMALASEADKACPAADGEEPRPVGESTVEREADGVPPRELTPNLPPRSDTRQRAANQGVGFDGANTPIQLPGAGASERRLTAFAVGASGRTLRRPARLRSPPATGVPLIAATDELREWRSRGNDR